MEDITNSRELVRHQMPNTEKNMLACSYCGKYFSQSGDKPFGCNQCDKAFSLAGPLKIYILMVFISQTTINEQSGDSTGELDWPPSFVATCVILIDLK